MPKKISKHMSQSRLKVQVSSCFLRVQCVVKQLQKDFLYLLYQDVRDCIDAKKITNEVHQRGQFPKFSPGSGEAKKFLLAFSFLQYPPFVKLLEAAKGEFGFDQQGVLVVPCEANELQRILKKLFPANTTRIFHLISQGLHDNMPFTFQLHLLTLGRMKWLP